MKNKICKVVIKDSENSKSGHYLAKSKCISGGYKMVTLDNYLTRAYMTKSGYVPQNIYICSDEPVVEGDILIRYEDGLVFQQQSLVSVLDGLIEHGVFGKVIATDDETLFTRSECDNCDEFGYFKGPMGGEFECDECSIVRLPGLTNEFVDRCLEPINKVKVQFNDDDELVLKDNKIVVEPIKTSWSASELDVILFRLVNDVVKSDTYGEDISFHLDNWKKENLI
jgi:hypothetical protein